MGKFVIKETTTGFRFDLKATNGEIIAGSQVYTTLASCENGIESIKNVCDSDVEDQTVEGFTELKHPKYELYKDKADEYRFRLKARNGEIVAVSEGYTTKSNCLNGIDSVKRNAANATVEKQA